MNKKNKRILLALAAAGFSTIMPFKILSPNELSEKDIVPVVEMKQDVPKNVPLTAEHVVIKKIPKTEAKPWMMESVEKVVGKITKVDLLAGEKLSEERLVGNVQDDFTAEDREINLALELKNVGGLPVAGNYIDIFAFFPPPEKGMGYGHSEVVMQNVLITQINTKDWEKIKTVSTPEELEKQKESSKKGAFVPATVTVKASVEDSLLLTTLQLQGEIQLRAVLRNENSKDLNLQSPTVDTLRRTIQYAAQKPVASTN